MATKLLVNRINFWFFILCLSFFVFSSESAKAVSVIADTPCDELYYESLSARAWLEAQREITQNQNIILKPDSVFEYTCFDRLLKELADHGDEMLSETTAYGASLGATSLDTALQNLVGASLVSYVNTNFGYYPGLLGGHTAALAIKHTPTSVTSNTSSAYSCDIMKKVWQAAKCINFITNDTNDGFYTFQEYTTTPLDKRALPTVCNPIITNWAQNLTTALTSGPWTNDPLQTYLAQTSPQDCATAVGGATNCKCTGDPIPTGLQVSGISPGPTNFQEHICIQPGCRYHPGGVDLFTGGTDPGAGCYGK